MQLLQQVVEKSDLIQFVAFKLGMLVVFLWLLVRFVVKHIREG